MDDYGYLDGDGQIPYGGILGCLPAPLLSGFGFMSGSSSASSAPVRYLCGIPSAPVRYLLYIYVASSSAEIAVIMHGHPCNLPLLYLYCYFFAVIFSKCYDNSYLLYLAYTYVLLIFAKNRAK